jgi:branched-chain amino acid transport system substrate-binding protein
MSDIGSNMTAVRSSRSRWMAALLGALLAGTAGSATGDNANIVRDLAGRVGPIIGSALACADIARSRIQFISDKFQAVIRETSSNEAERDDLSRLLDRYVADGRSAVTVGRTDCRSAERQLADLEQSLAGKAPSPSPSLAAVVAPSSAAAATAPTAPLPQPGPTSTARGVTANEIRFGIVAPFSGPAKELGRQM